MGAATCSIAGKTGESSYLKTALNIVQMMSQKIRNFLYSIMVGPYFLL